MAVCSQIMCQAHIFPALFGGSDDGCARAVASVRQIKQVCLVARHSTLNFKKSVIDNFVLS